MIKILQLHDVKTLAIALAAASMVLPAMTATAQSITAPGSPAARAVPEDVSLPIDAMFRDMRAVYAKDATADKIAVTVRERDRMPQTAVLTVRQGWVMVRDDVRPAPDPAAAPGAIPSPGNASNSSPPAAAVPVERRVRAVSVDAGDLRLHVQGSTLTVTLASNPTTYFATEVEDGPITPQLTRIIGSLPLLPLIIADWRDGEAFPAIVPQVDRPGSNWFKATTRLEPAGSPITLLGNTPFGPMSMQVDGKTFRPTQALAAVSPAPRATVMELELTPRESGDPSKWGVSLDGRTRVDSISRLARRIEPDRRPGPAQTDSDPAGKPDANPPTPTSPTNPTAPLAPPTPAP